MLGDYNRRLKKICLQTLSTEWHPLCLLILALAKSIYTESNYQDYEMKVQFSRV